MGKLFAGNEWSGRVWPNPTARMHQVIISKSSRVHTAESILDVRQHVNIESQPFIYCSTLIMHYGAIYARESEGRGGPKLNFAC